MSNTPFQPGETVENTHCLRLGRAVVTRVSPRVVFIRYPGSAREGGWLKEYVRRVPPQAPN